MARYVNEDGEAENTLLHLADLKDGRASTIVEAISNHFDKKGLSMTNVVGLATDAAVRQA